ncbi:uncharacterized protein [Asterias amurensis]|uniref:uncharacterized protein n=1 Tax=Asterias amurensis TaxID=7602 RepID=UPI003AB6CDE7
MASDATGESVQTTACDATDKENGVIHKKPDSEKEVSKEKDGEKGETEGLVMDSLRSPRQTRVRRISLELRLSASSSVENFKKAGKGLSSGLHNVANKLPVPRSLQRRSRSYENLEENSLLHPDTPKKADGGDGDIRKSKSTENLKKIKDEKEDGSRGDKRFLRRKWEARKNRQQQENKSDCEKAEKTSAEDTVSDDAHAPEDDGLAVDSIPIVFEPLTLGQRPLTPTVTICLTDDENRNTNPFLD